MNDVTLATWKHLKDAVEKAGVKDDDLIGYINTATFPMIERLYVSIKEADADKPNDRRTFYVT